MRAFSVPTSRSSSTTTACPSQPMSAACRRRTPARGYFETLGLRMLGPVDGHDLRALLAGLELLRDASGPTLLHVRTRKGKGFAPAEADPFGWHATAPFDRDGREAQRGRRRPAELDGLLRRGADPGRGPRSARRRHHGGHARRHRPRPSLRAGIPIASTTSASPSSTPSPSRRGSRPRASAPSARSTRPSCSAPSIRSSTTSRCRSCR